MKITLSLLLFFVCININSQSFLGAYEATREREPFANLNGTDIRTGVGNSQEWSKIVSAIGEFDNIDFGEFHVEGSIYLFDEWENKGEIYLGNKKYVTSNINLNINKDIFMSKIEGDSTFVYDILSLDKIVVNNRQFRSFYNPSENKNRIFEILFEEDNILLLRGYYITFIKSSPNPMVNRPDNKIKQRSNYFIYKNKSLQPFKLNKKKYLNLVSDEQKKELAKYVKNYKLSFTKEKDISMILTEISKLNHIQ